MKKITIIFSLVFSSLFSQNHIETIEHGESYEKLKNMSHYDLEDTYKDNYYTLEYNFNKVEMTNSYAFSTFISKFKTYCYKNRQYSEGLTKLANQFESELINKLIKNQPKAKTSTHTFSYGISYFFDEKNFSKNSSAYVKALLEKYEIICKYYANKYNYQIDKFLQDNEIKENKKQLNNSVLNSTKSEKLLISESLELKKINEKEKLELKEVNLKYQFKLDSLSSIENEKLKKLPPENYNLNSSKIKIEFNDYKKLESIKKKKEISIIENNYSVLKNNEIIKIKNQISKDSKELNIIANSKKIDAQKEIVNKYNLSKIREDFESNYEIEINNIDLKIENILLDESKNKSTTTKKVKKVLGKYF